MSATDCFISNVRHAPGRSRITHVKAWPNHGTTIGTPVSTSRSAVIDAIAAGMTFVTMFGSGGKWKYGEDVRVVVDGERFIRTDANRTKADNLGELPEF